MSLVVGVTKLAWMFDRSRDWAERLLEEWQAEDRAIGRTPPRVFKQGKRGSLFTTMGVLHQYMPPGRDLALYRRMKDVEEGLEATNRRIDREIDERKREDESLRRELRTRRAS